DEDDVVDRLETEVDQMCVDVLVLKQPAASDLRFVVSVARTAPMVERIADHAVNIAKHKLSLNGKPPLEPELDLSNMAEVVQEMLVDGIDAFNSGDPEKAREIIERDDEVDSLYSDYYAALISAMERDSSLVARGVEWLSVLKHLERIAD